MLNNLDKARRKNKITLTDIGDLLGMRYQTVSDKITGISGFKYSEAVLVHKKFFPEYDFEWLFWSDSLEEKLRQII